MDSTMVFPGEMRLDVRLTAERAGVRVFKLEVKSPADGGRESARGIWRRARDVVRVFVEAVDVGLWNGASEERAEILQTTAAEDAGERSEVWEMKTPPIDVEAFAVLARMLWGVSARSVSVIENAREERLTVRDLPPPRTVRVTPWEVNDDLHGEAKGAVLTVCFRSDPPPEIVRDTHRTLKAWGALVGWGGFPGPSGFPLSSAVLSECGTELASEVFVSFEGIALARDGWGALWNGLRRIHKHAPIARVQMH